MSDSDSENNIIWDSEVTNETESIPIEINDRDKIYSMILSLQEYCQNNHLPIFNRSDTLSIVMDCLL